MAWPSPTDFRAAAPWSAWWLYARPGGAVDVCAGTGAAVIGALRAGARVAPGAAWDDALQAALVQAADELNASFPNQGWMHTRDQMQASARARVVDKPSLAFALYLAFYRTAGLPADGIGVPSGVLPAWGANGGGSAADGIVCWNKDNDEPPWHLSDAELAAARAQSARGLRLHPGESLPSSHAPSAPAGPAGLSGLPLVLALAAGAAVVVAISSMAKPSKAK